ncbi:hypothetical protein PENSPDRAFT_718576 [Peniophora sp. CONT]|nr:hypothetical protein PENSPDRAFT_718576 [Peniophora sp. CONT]
MSNWYGVGTEVAELSSREDLYGMSVCLLDQSVAHNGHMLGYCDNRSYMLVSTDCCPMVLWTWDARVTTLGAVLFLAVLGTDIRITVTISSSYDPVFKFCSLDEEHSNIPNTLALLICLCRWHRPRKGVRAFRLWSVLWNQGILYLTLASLTEIPAVTCALTEYYRKVVLLLNVNLLVLVLSTTRFYRSLHAFTPNQTRDDFTNTVCFATVDVGSEDEPWVYPSRIRVSREKFATSLDVRKLLVHQG